MRYKIDIKTSNKNIKKRNGFIEDNWSKVAKRIENVVAFGDFDTTDIHIERINGSFVKKDLKNLGKDNEPLAKDIFTKIGKECGVDIKFKNLTEQIDHCTAYQVINLFVNFLIKDGWVYIYNDYDCVIYARIDDEDGMKCIKIPASKETKQKELASVFAALYKIYKDKYSKEDFAKKIFGERSVDRVLKYNRGL